MYKKGKIYAISYFYRVKISDKNLATEMRWRCDRSVLHVSCSVRYML